MTRMRLPSIIALAAALAACALHAQDMFRGDPAHRGVSPASAPSAFHRVRWSFPTGGRIVSSPVPFEGLVIFGSDDGSLYAVEAASGRQRWVVRTHGPVASTPAVADGRVFAESYDGRMYAVDARSGEILWKFATQGERRFEGRGLHGMTPKSQTYPDLYDVFLSSAVVAGGRVFFGSGDGHVYALDAATGAVRWAYQAGVDPLIHNQQGFQSSAAVADGTVFVGCRDGHLYALDARAGTSKWSVDTAGSWVVGSPAVSGGRVFYATSDSALFRAADAATGQPVFEKSTKAYVFSSPVVAGDVVLVGVLNGILQARDRRSGDVLWEFRTDASRANAGWVLTSDARFNSAFLFPSSWGDVSAQGTQLQQSVGSFYSTPLVLDGVVYVGSADGNLYAIE